MSTVLQDQKWVPWNSLTFSESLWAPCDAVVGNTTSLVLGFPPGAVCHLVCLPRHVASDPHLWVIQAKTCSCDFQQFRKPAGFVPFHQTSGGGRAFQPVILSHWVLREFEWGRALTYLSGDVVWVCEVFLYSAVSKALLALGGRVSGRVMPHDGRLCQECCHSELQAGSWPRSVLSMLVPYSPHMGKGARSIPCLIERLLWFLMRLMKVSCHIELSIFPFS